MSPLTYARPKRVWRQRHQTPFLFQDAFAVPFAAPFPSPRIAEPGPGSWLSNDPDLRVSIPAGGGLLYGPPAGAGAWDRTMLAATTPFARKPGLYCEFELTPTNIGYFRAGWNFSLPSAGGGTGATGTIQNNEATIYVDGAGFIVVTDGLDVASPLYPYSPGTSYTFRIYATDEGWLYYVCPTASLPNGWVLLWERVHGFPHVPHFTPHYNNHSLTGTSSHFLVRQGTVKPAVLELAAPDWQGFQYSPGADGIYSADVTADPPLSFLLGFRHDRTFENGWWVEMDAFHQTMTLVKVINAVSTTIAVTSVLWQAGKTYRISVFLSGPHIRTFYGLNSGPSTDDPQFATHTAVTTLGKPPYLTQPGDPGKIQNLRFRTGGRLLFN